nr:hypothetical protein [Moraxella atlantae]
MTETRARYRKHDATESNLEPDIKHAPGGLRDIQTVRWIGLRYFAVANLEAVLATVTAAGFITANEYQTLHEAEGFCGKYATICTTSQGATKTACCLIISAMSLSAWAIMPCLMTAQMLLLSV